MNAEALKFDNLHYYKIGIGKQDSETSIFLNNKEEIIKIRTLETILKMNGDENKSLTYLKVDVEGYEIWSLICALPKRGSYWETHPRRLRDFLTPKRFPEGRG